MKLIALYEFKVGDTFTYVPGGFKLKVAIVNDAPETNSGKVVVLKDVESGERHTFDMDELANNEDYVLNESFVLEDDENVRDDPSHNPLLAKYNDLNAYLKDVVHDFKLLDLESDFGETLYNDEKTRKEVRLLLDMCVEIRQQLAELEREGQR